MTSHGPLTVGAVAIEIQSPKFTGIKLVAFQLSAHLQWPTVVNFQVDHYLVFTSILCSRLDTLFILTSILCLRFTTLFMFYPNIETRPSYVLTIVLCSI